MRFLTFEDAAVASHAAAEVFAETVRRKPDCVLGLATGSSPLALYGVLCGEFRAGRLDFARVRTVNLDEYVSLSPDHPESYRYFMNKNLFDQINIDKKNTLVPRGDAADPAAEAASYDARCAAFGQVDVQLLGVGNNGHIAFNEPDDALLVPTHVTALTPSTIAANARFFASEDEVPREAITMGIGSILRAKKIVLLAFGRAKHAALAALRDDRITTAVPATLLKLHPDVTVYCDKEAFEG